MGAACPAGLRLLTSDEKGVVWGGRACCLATLPVVCPRREHVGTPCRLFPRVGDSGLMQPLDLDSGI